MPDNPLELEQANVRMTKAMADAFRKYGQADGFNWQKVMRDAFALYISMRRSMSPRVWYLLHGAAQSQGKEAGELLAELAESGYAEHHEELFAPQRESQRKPRPAS